MPRSFLLAAVLSTLWAAAPLRAIEYAELGRYWSRDAQHVPYRAIETPGRRDGERLPLVVFLHGDWQDGDDNEGQLAGYGNGSLELVDAAPDPLDERLLNAAEGVGWNLDRVLHALVQHSAMDGARSAV